jgi:hypothetical protein
MRYQRIGSLQTTGAHRMRPVALATQIGDFGLKIDGEGYFVGVTEKLSASVRSMPTMVKHLLRLAITVDGG